LVIEATVKPLLANYLSKNIIYPLSNETPLTIDILLESFTKSNPSNWATAYGF